MRPGLVIHPESGLAGTFLAKPLVDRQLAARGVEPRDHGAMLQRRVAGDDDAQRLLAQGKTVKMLMVGRKGAEALKREFGSHYIDRIDLRAVRQIAFANADEIARKLLQLYEAGEFDVATLYFSEFKSVIAQKPTALQLIPAKLPEKAEGTQNAKAEAIYEYEPSEEEILGQLLKRNIATQIFRGLLENAAGEQGARMTAMDNATRNAGDMINKLTIKYNRQRQANITKELIQIISGAEAL